MEFQSRLRWALFWCTLQWLVWSIDNLPNFALPIKDWAKYDLPNVQLDFTNVVWLNDNLPNYISPNDVWLNKLWFFEIGLN